MRDRLAAAHRIADVAVLFQHENGAPPAAAYRAAVVPAGPAPTTTTSYVFVVSIQEMKTLATSRSMEGWLHMAVRNIPPTVRFSSGSFSALSQIPFSALSSRRFTASLIL